MSVALIEGALVSTANTSRRNGPSLNQQRRRGKNEKVITITDYQICDQLARFSRQELLTATGGCQYARTVNHFFITRVCPCSAQKDILLRNEQGYGKLYSRLKLHSDSINFRRFVLLLAIKATWSWSGLSLWTREASTGLNVRISEHRNTRG